MSEFPVCHPLGWSSKEKSWRAHLLAQKNSGLTQAEYCRRSQLSKSTFGWWKRKLREDRPGVLELVPVKIGGAPFAEARHQQPSCDSGLTLVAGTGFRIEIASDFHSPSLARLLQVLGRA